MLKIVKEIKLSKARDAEHGNVQYFLERLLVDVAAANYRYFLNDYLSKARTGQEDPHKACHFPLLDNEAQVSGLFASALSGFCPVFRPEFPLDGHVDFMVTYGEREIALENKQVVVSTVTDGGDVSRLEDRWKSVVEQSRRRLECMSAEPQRFRHPASIGLLIVRVSKKVNAGGKSDPIAKAEKTLEAALSDFRVGAKKLGEAVGKKGSNMWAHFVASYEYPREMQLMAGWKHEKLTGDERVFPGVVFLAHVCSRK